jgi:hypothetical protein
MYTKKDDLKKMFTKNVYELLYWNKNPMDELTKMFIEDIEKVLYWNKKPMDELGPKYEPSRYYDDEEVAAQYEIMQLIMFNVCEDGYLPLDDDIKDEEICKIENLIDEYNNMYCPMYSINRKFIEAATTFVYNWE